MNLNNIVNAEMADNIHRTLNRQERLPKPVASSMGSQLQFPLSL